MQLTGRWYGITQGYETLPHDWMIYHVNGTLHVFTCWPTETTRTHFVGMCVGPVSIQIGASEQNYGAGTILAPDRFVLSNWVGDPRASTFTPTYDVLFQRRDHGLKQLLYAMRIAIFARRHLKDTYVKNIF